MEEQTIHDPKGVIKQYLDSAIDIEDHIGHKVYNEYLDRSLWPDNVSEEYFEHIVSHINILISDTENHRRALVSLRSRLAEEG